MSTPNPNSRLTLQDFDRYQWATALDKIEPKQCQRYSEEFGARAEAYRLAGDLIGQEIFNFLSSINSILMEPLGRKNMSFLEEEVSLSLSDEQLTLLRELVMVIADPELRARIADILWMCKRDPERNRPIQMAGLAVESYLQAAKNLENDKNWMPCYQRLQRAAQLALRVDGRKKIEMCCIVISHIEKLIDRYATVENEFITGSAMMVLQEDLRKSLSVIITDLPLYAKDYAELAAQKVFFAESIQNHHEAFHQKQAYRRLESEWYKIANDKEAKRKAKIQIGELKAWYAQQALIQNEPTPSAVAAGRIRDALIDFKKVEDEFGQRQDTSERIKELHHQMLIYQKQSLSQMNEIPAQIDDFYDLEMQETARELVKGKTLFDALYSLAFGCRLIRSTEDVQAEAEEENQTHKFNSIPMAFLDEEGKAKAISGNKENDLKSKMFEIAKFYQQWYGLNFIIPACQQICSEHTVILEDLSFMFQENPFIPHGREPIYAQGLIAGLRGDLIVATHLLIPQLENSLRYILKQSGFITSKRETIQDDFLLHEVLNSPDLKYVLNQDLIFTLKGLLVERMGSNLRNDICHGLLSYDRFFMPELPYFWWLTLYLCLVPFYRYWADSNKKNSQ